MFQIEVLIPLTRTLICCFTTTSLHMSLVPKTIEPSLKDSPKIHKFKFLLKLGLWVKFLIF